MPKTPLGSFTATEAKNEFGRILESVIQGNVIVITKHDAPKAVLMSIDEYNALAGAPIAKINDLTAEFDALLNSMQGPKVRNAMKAAFHSSPKQLGRAFSAARKRG